MRRRRLVLLVLLASAAFAQQEPLRVMTFNVRYPAKSDGPNLWDLRKDLLVETIASHKPDVFGTQELFKIQGDYVVEKLPAYTWFGVSRRGNEQDEHMGVFYRKDRLRLIESGNYWLSETPDEPGSMSWNVSLPRMVTWGLFEDRVSAKRFYFLNTHFPHRGSDAAARLECARVIARKIGELPGDATLIVTGDFNTGAGTEPHQLLTKTLEDAWLKAASRSGPEGTFHGFRGEPGRERIDWILYRGPLAPQRAETVTDNRDGRYPSDHFPVEVQFLWQ